MPQYVYKNPDSPVDVPFPHLACSRSSFRFWLMLLACAIPISALIVSVLFGHRNASDGGLHLSSPLSVPESALEIGDVWNKRFLRHPIRITNISKQAQTCQIETGCDCAIVEPTTLTLQPQQAQTVLVNLRLPSASPDTPTPFEVPLLAKIPSDPDLFVSWNLRGTNRSEFTVIPESIQFDELLVNSPQLRPLDLCIRSLRSVVAWDVSTKHQWLEITRINASSNPDEFRAVIKPTPIAVKSAGEFDDTVVVSTRTAEGPQLASLEIPVHFVVRHDVKVEEPLLFLGQNPVGAAAQGKFRLVSMSGQPFVVEELTCADPNLTIVTPAALIGAIAAKEYDMKYRISKLGSNRAEVRLKVVDKTEALPYYIDLSVRAIGI